MTGNGEKPRRARRAARAPSADELELWAQVTDTLDWRKVDPRKTEAPAPAEPAPFKAQKLTGFGSLKPNTPASKHKEPTKNVPPLQAIDGKTIRKAARGRENIGAVLDLHHHTQDQANKRLRGFLQQAQAESMGLVLVITGKGHGRGRDDPYGAREEGILQRAVKLWLALPEYRSIVIGFAEAHRTQGGAGALYIRIRRQGRA